MIPQEKSNNDNYCICSLEKKGNVFRLFLGTLMNFPSAEEIGGRIIISQMGKVNTRMVK